MNELTARPLIDPDALDGRDYLVSLLAAGQTAGLLTPAETAAIQLEAAQLLRTQAESYTGGESTSLRAETAEALLRSVLYTVGMTLKAYPTPEAALDALRRGKMDRLFDSGRRRISAKLKNIRALHAQLGRTLFRTENVFYRATLSGGIAGFLKLYRPEFAAQETHITLDYPLCTGPLALTGVELIERYLRSAVCENRFLRCFEPERVHALLLSLGEGYRQTVMNLYEPVLIAALGCVMTHRPPEELDCRLDELLPLLGGGNTEHLLCVFSDAAQELISRLSVPPATAEYIRASLPFAVSTVSRAMSLGHPETAILHPIRAGERPRLELDGGARMADSEYLRILAELAECTAPPERARLLLERSIGLDDLLELLHDSAAGAEEMDALLEGAPLSLSAALLSRFPEPELCEDETERTLALALLRFALALPPEQRKRLRAAARLLRGE